jgi:hypothetical protein
LNNVDVRKAVRPDGIEGEALSVRVGQAVARRSKPKEEAKMAGSP